MAEEPVNRENKVNPEGVSGAAAAQPSEQPVPAQPIPSQEQSAASETAAVGGTTQATQPEAVAEEQPTQAEEGKSEGRRRKWALILVLVLVVGVGTVVIGFISGRKAREAKLQQRETRVVPSPAVEEKDALTEQYEQQSSSDEIADIEADLNATTFEGIDGELTDIDKELTAEE